MADAGFPVSGVTARTWTALVAMDALRGGAEGTRVFLPGGRPSAVRQVFANPDLARSLRLIASDGRNAFSGGDIVARTLAASVKRGGAVRAGDLAYDAAE